MKEKLKVIIDSDTANEVDDSFALAYALSNRDVLDIKAITLEPFVVGYKHITPKDSQIESKNEANRVLRLMGIKDAKLVVKGSEEFLSNGYEEITPAVEKIIELGKKGEITIIAMGVLTNIAIALKKDPTIAKNLHIVWLGTKNLLHETFDDCNYKKDKLAFEVVLKSTAQVTVIPSYIGKFIVSSTHELKKNVAVNDIGKYLLRLSKTVNYENEGLGVKTLYDIAPVAYIVNPEMFDMKTLPANYLFKEQKKTLMSRRVNYVYDMAPNNVVWQDFVAKLAKNTASISPTQVFFTSNTYFTDEKQIKTKLTPYKSVEEMDEDLISRWNSVVGKKDIVYHVGDFGKYCNVKKLNGKIYLICGNHEKWVYGRGFEKFRQTLLDMGFADVYKEGTYLDKKILGEKVYLTYKAKDCKKDCMNLYGQSQTIGGSVKNGFNVSALYNNFTPLTTSQVKANLNFIKEAIKKEKDSQK